MEDPFTKYFDQKYSSSKSYYDHHRLQPRNVKTKENHRPGVPTNPRSNEPSRNTYRVVQNSIEKIQDIKNIPIRLHKEPPTKTQIIGRDLFKKEIQNSTHLGPADYQPTLQRSNTFGYIRKVSPQQKTIPSKRIKDRISEFMGPGRYAHQESQNFLSRHRSLSGGRFGSERLVRCILSKEKVEKINLRMSGEDEEKEMWRKRLGPGFYDVQKSQAKIDRFTKTFTLPVSMTERSSLIKKEKLPGPGYYDWQKGSLVAKLEEKYKKPKIQFKSVH